MNIRDFGAKNDCVTDDTHALSRLFHKCVPVLLLAGFLSACSVGTDRLQGYINIAQTAVDIAADTADSCVRRQLPLCVGKEEQIAQSKAVAYEALAEAKKYAAEGASEDLVRATLRIAMNALLMFYPSK